MGRIPSGNSILVIAREAGTSPATVSRVINQRAGVSEEKRKLISQLLEKHSFVSTRKPVRKPKIAIVTHCADILNDYICKALSGIYESCRKNQLDSTIMTVNAAEADSGIILDMVRDQQCFGVIVLLPEGVLDSLSGLGDSELPVALLDFPAIHPNISYYDHDSYHGSCQATKHLLELGHRKIGYVQYVNTGSDHIKRQKGYENALREAGIEVNPKWIVYTNNDYALSQESRGYAAMKQLLAGFDGMTAVMTANDNLAMGAMAAIHEAGMRIPDDISIIGFDNYDKAEFFFPPLTTVNHPIAESGYRAAEWVACSIRTPVRCAPVKEILPVKLVVRKSTGIAKTDTGCLTGGNNVLS